MRTKGKIEMKLEAELARITHKHTVGDITDAERDRQAKKLAQWFAKEIGKLPISEAFELLRDHVARHAPDSGILQIPDEILQIPDAKEILQ
jgi:hypothetical protein